MGFGSAEPGSRIRPRLGSLWRGLALTFGVDAGVAQLGDRLFVDSLDGISDDELDRSAGGEWTPRQTAHHLADSEMMSAIRIRRLLTEDAPGIDGYDEATFAGKPRSAR